MKHFFYYRFSPSPSVRTVLRYISAMDMKPLFHSVMRNKRKLLYGIIPVPMTFFAFCRFSLMFPALHMKKNRIVFPSFLCIQGCHGPGKNMGNGCPYFPSLPGQALYADNPAVLFLNLLLCNKDTIAPFSERAL